MKFLCLGYLNIEYFDRQPEDVKAAILEKCFTLCVPFRATGKVAMEHGIQAPSFAKSIRPVDGTPTVTNGPFFESRAQLGSVFIIEAEDIDEAVRIASLHPAALFGEEFGFGIEVRPLQ